MGNVAGRSTVYNRITSDEKMALVNKENIELENDFLEYLQSVDRSVDTIKQYKANLHVFWCWNLEYNDNKFFVDLKKRELVRFQNHCINEWGWSPKRTRTVKATLSSLSNYISNILDEDFEDFRPIVRKVENPVNDVVREKTVFTKEELDALLGKLVEMKDYEKACLIALAIYSGKRKAELTRFKVSYFDDANLICDGAIYKTPEKIKSKGRGKNGKMIDVYILAKPFKPYFDMWMQDRKEKGIESIWLFPKIGDPENHVGVTTLDSWVTLINKLIDKPLYLHSLRHYCTSYLLENNIPEAIVQEYQQWSSSDMVSVYDDRNKELEFEKFFGAEGIKQVEKKGLNSL